MMRVPFHKQTDPAKQAGQIKNEVTLGDYLEKKYPEEMKKKLTFDEWWHQNNDDSLCYNCAKHTWQAAQENK